MTVNITSAKLLKATQLVLLVAIFILTLWGRPWNSSTAGVTKTIKVSGESTIEESPDEFTFYPYFQESGTDQEALKESLNKQVNDTVEQLIQIGVEEKNITLDVSSYDYWYYSEDEEGSLTARLTIKVPAGDTVQEVQDYLLTIPVEGQITPQATFSTQKQKELDAKATEEAIADAKVKAEQQASLVNAKIGDVLNVEQGRDTIFPEPYAVADSAIAENGSSSTIESLPVLPGQNDYTQTVTITYELK